MKNIYDYDKKSFKRVLNEKGDYLYYIKVDKDYIEVSREVYLVCMNSYAKIKYDKEREVARSVQYFEDIDQATSFIFSSMTLNINKQLYIKDLADLAIQEIHKLSDKYRKVAICIFIDELTERETAEKLKTSKSTVHKRKIKIQKILQEFLKKGRQS